MRGARPALPCRLREDSAVVGRGVLTLLGCTELLSVAMFLNEFPGTFSLNSGGEAAVSTTSSFSSVILERNASISASDNTTGEF